MTEMDASQEKDSVGRRKHINKKRK